MALNVSSLLRRWHTHFVLSHPPPLHCVAHSWLQIVKSTVSDTGEEIWCLSVKHSNGDSVACLCHFWLQICHLCKWHNHMKDDNNYCLSYVLTDAFWETSMHVVGPLSRLHSPEFSVGQQWETRVVFVCRLRVILHSLPEAECSVYFFNVSSV